MEITKTAKELDLINMVQLDIGVATDKARSILHFVVEEYFSNTEEFFKKDDIKQACLISEYGNISNMLFAVEDYIFAIRKYVDSVN